MLVAGCLLRGVVGLPFVVVGCSLLFAVVCLLVVVRYLLFVACLTFVVCSLFFVAGCSLMFVLC